MGLSLKQWRLAKEISQAEMASKCGVHRNTYAAWEENPDEISVGNAKIIAKALKESVDTIFLIAILQNVGMIKKGGERSGKSTAGDYFSSRNFQMDCISVELYGGASVLCRMRTGNTG